MNMTTFGVFSHQAKILPEKPEKLNVKKLTITYPQFHDVICKPAPVLRFVCVKYTLLASSELATIQVIINIWETCLWTIG